jgi:molybdate-binding protein
LSAPDKIEWSVTVDDPSSWARPWTFAMPLTRNDSEAIFEYACHEGNLAMAHLLSAARKAEAAGLTATDDGVGDSEAPAARPAARAARAAEPTAPVTEPRTPNPESRTPNPESRTPNPEPRIPNLEPRIPNPESRVLAAYPMGQGSGSVTTFSRADGFTTIGRHEEIVPAGTIVTVQLLGHELQLADLVVIGSHCIGLDYLLGELQKAGVRSKFIAVGSLAGLEAAKRGECDVAGVHLLDTKTGEYNRPFLTPALDLIPGYGRLQGIVYRKGDTRFEGRTAEEAIAAAIADVSCVMVNRNQGSGTRALIERLLGGAKPPGHAVQPRTHNAVAAAVVQQRADWGVTLDTIARTAALGFIPVQHEQYDFVTPKARAERDPVKAFRALLDAHATRDTLRRLGMKP